MTSAGSSLTSVALQSHFGCIKRWRSIPSGKCSQERLAQGTVTCTMRVAAQPGAHPHGVQDAELVLVLREQNANLCLHAGASGTRLRQTGKIRVCFTSSFIFEYALQVCFTVRRLRQLLHNRGRCLGDAPQADGEEALVWIAALRQTQVLECQTFQKTRPKWLLVQDGSNSPLRRLRQNGSNRTLTLWHDTRLHMPATGVDGSASVSRVLLITQLCQEGEFSLLTTYWSESTQSSR